MSSVARVGRLASISIDCPDPEILAAFYGGLMGMERVYERPENGIIAVSDGDLWVTFIKVEAYQAPIWPDPDRPQQMHLDLVVDDLSLALDAALALGARLAQAQPGPESWLVLLDPAGHPFCLTIDD